MICLERALWCIKRRQQEWVPAWRVEKWGVSTCFVFTIRHPVLRGNPMPFKYTRTSYIQKAGDCHAGRMAWALNHRTTAEGSLSCFHRDDVLTWHANSFSRTIQNNGIWNSINKVSRNLKYPWQRFVRLGANVLVGMCFGAVHYH